jgi:diadenosine tetraphosphate (Ap4A) HIT family hydrolase
MKSIGKWYLTPSYIGPKRHVYVVDYHLKNMMFDFTLIQFYSEHDVTFGHTTIGPDKHWTTYSPNSDDLQQAVMVVFGDKR